MERKLEVPSCSIWCGSKTMRHDMSVSRSFQEFHLLLTKDTLHEATKILGVMSCDVSWNHSITDPYIFPVKPFAKSSIIFTSFSRVVSLLTDSVLHVVLEFPTASTLHCWRFDGLPVMVRCMKLVQSRNGASDCCDPAKSVTLDRWSLW